jgi:hypothetical protein
MIRFIVIFMVLFMLSGCYNNPDILKPMPWIFNHVPENAPSNYKRGWKDGCESGLATMTTSAYRAWYAFRQDNSLRENVTYYKSWKDSFDYCRQYAYGTLRESDQRSGLQPKRGGIPSPFNPQEAMGSGILVEGPLQWWGPGGNTLLPFTNFGSLSGDPYLGVGNSERQAVGGVSTLDYSGIYSFGNTDATNIINVE